MSYKDYFDAADNLRGSGGVFPKGVYRGTIAGPSLADENPRIEIGTPEGWSIDDETLERLRFSLRENEPIDGDDPGEGWMFVDLTLTTNGFTFRKMAPEGTIDYFALTSAIVKLGDLADQLGFDIEEDNWQGDLIEFAGLMTEGKFTGKKVTFETFHKTTKKGKTVVNITPRGFKQAE